MAIYSYALGASNPPTNLETLLSEAGFLNGLVPRSVFREVAQQVDRLDAHVSGQGNIQAEWTFDLLTQSMVNTLRTICSGQSAAVYLTTRKNDGTFATYSAIMIWPSLTQMERRRFKGRYLGLEFQFRQLEAV